MRPVPQVGSRLVLPGGGSVQELAKARREGETKKVGMNLFMCIPPDHMRDDLPSEATPYQLMEVSRSFDSVAPHLRCLYVGVTDDLGNVVTLPCFDIKKSGDRIVLMAHRTGRPVA